MILETTRVIAWDFDGVLNRNIENGEYVWARNLEHDLNLPIESFVSFMFQGRFQKALVGDADLRELTAAWLSKFDRAPDVDEFMTYWFGRDVLPDKQMLAVLKRLKGDGLMNIIATNNDIHRTKFIEFDMGFGDIADHIFAAGRMKIAKPSPRFFWHIENALDIPPEAFLLVDDLEANVIAARDAGWQAIFYRDGDYEPVRKGLGI